MAAGRDINRYCALACRLAHEQLNGGAVISVGQHRYATDSLTLDFQRRPTGCDNTERRTPIEQLVGNAGALIEQMLTVVEQQHAISRRELALDLPNRVVIRQQRQIDSLSESVGNVGLSAAASRSAISSLSSNCPA